MKDKKNIIIIILTVLVVILGGYLVYDKLNNKSNCDVNNKQEGQVSNTNVDKNNESSKDFNGLNYVGLAYTAFKEFDWPTAAVGYEEGEPKKLVRQVNLPKINITTDATEKLNKKILDDSKNDIEMVEQGNSENDMPISSEVNYTYAVLNNIIFISVTVDSNFYRGSSSSYVKVYYYDIDADKELTYKEALAKLGVDEKNVLEFIADKTNGTDLQKIDNIYPTDNNEYLYIYYETEEAFMGSDRLTYSLVK